LQLLAAAPAAAVTHSYNELGEIEFLPIVLVWAKLVLMLLALALKEYS
jgi:hypothetical protein